MRRKYFNFRYDEKNCWLLMRKCKDSTSFIIFLQKNDLSSIFNLSGFLIPYDIGLFRRASDVRLKSSVVPAIIFRG